MYKLDKNIGKITIISKNKYSIHFLQFSNISPPHNKKYNTYSIVSGGLNSDIPF